ncbi:TIGR00730 family Rossman fold protein [Candidatus Odyssella thessalonicensis]|uniref:LOG family protein n=1 Tax=Candidatus Odyssella thessalonicensis TaxID=84647 RepID=UPI000225AECD|nr:TIGR00730 family Rossman fold protein [Candidatus Odyssella thessalonicensis]
MSALKTICVYCGASTRVDAIYRETAARTGELLARSGFNVVYGGGRLGLMGIVADNALAHGSHVTGIIPTLLEKIEGTHPGLSETEVVDTMHTRKRKMSELADAFIILPGGFGTLDELFEILTWRQLQMHDKLIVIINTNGYWDPLKALIHNIIEEKFATPAHATFAKFVATPDEAIHVLIQEPEPELAFSGQHI